MNIEAVKDKKMKLEETISKLITQFEEETETKIEDVHISRISWQNCAGTYYSTNVEVEVTI